MFWTFLGFFASTNVLAADEQPIVIPVGYQQKASVIAKEEEQPIWDDRFNDGLLLTMDGNYAAAESTYNDIIKSTNSSKLQARAQLSIGELYQYYVENYEKSRTIYQSILDKYPDTPFAESALFNLGLASFHDKKYSEAYSSFTTYAGKYPDGRYKDNVKFMTRETGIRLGITLPREPGIVIAGSTDTTDNSDDETGFILPSRMDDVQIRVVLSQRQSSIYATSAEEFQVFRNDEPQRVFTTGSGTSVSVRYNRGTWSVDGRTVSADKIILVPINGSPFRFNNRLYRGSLQLSSDGGRITAINMVSLEQYLYSVVPKEVGNEWPMEALKAQAVAARTYAVARMASRINADWDVMPGQSDQVYGGYESERERTTRAVEETRGQILVYNGRPITSYFCSNSGGMTEAGRYPYLRSFPDPYSKNSPGYRWTLRISASELAQRLKSKGYNVGTVNSVIASDRSSSGRVRSIRIAHSKGMTYIPGDDFRWKVDSTYLRSTLFTVSKSGQTFTFEGYGYGHGYGLSQWGCYQQAKLGRDYREILSFYYPGTTFDELADHTAKFAKISLR